MIKWQTDEMIWHQKFIQVKTFFPSRSLKIVFSTFEKNLYNNCLSLFNEERESWDVDYIK
jgi:hypothetical protein